MTGGLMPRDRGEALEPHTWPYRGDKTDLGKVDFDNEEGATITTIQIVRNDPIPSTGEEYTIRIAASSDDFVIEFMED